MAQVDQVDAALVRIADNRVTAADEPSLPTPLAGFGVAWAIFWVLLFTVGVQDYWRQGGTELWKPLLWEGSSFLVASAIVWAQWRRAARGDHLLAQPWRWFAHSLQWLPLAAPAFVAVVYALRHAVYALVGQTYDHAAWGTVFRYEILKFAVFYLLFVALFFGIRSHAALSSARIRLERERALAQHAQLLQLTQQIEPHFLFNALNTIASTIHTDPNLADALLTQLTALLRAATDVPRKPETTLDEELRLLEAYAAIMRQRFAERVELRFEIDPAARTCRVPTLLLQPLLENAFRHGVEKRSQRSQIVVRAELNQQRLRLEVQDDAGQLNQAPAFGVGLENLRQRLFTRYGERATLALRAIDAGGVLARVELPCER
ncbi:MAG: histidine kinase [Burkholderiaceae bacterium]